MKRRLFLLGALLAPGSAAAAFGDTAGLASFPDSSLVEAQWGPPPGPPPRRWRGRGPRCRLVRRQVPVTDRWGNFRGYRWVTREICRW